MARLNDVKDINFDIANEELVINHYDTYNQVEVASIYPTNIGQTIQAERNNDKWELEIKSGQVSTDFTEIKTRRGDSKINFDEFNMGDAPLITFIGITDIRDGHEAPKWDLAFGSSPLSLLTNGAQNQLVIRKQHQIN